MKPVSLIVTSVAILVFVVSVLNTANNDAPEENTHVLPKPPVQHKAVNDAVAPQPEKLLTNQHFKQSIRGVAKSFAEQSRFPAFSMPIQDEESLQKYIPNQAVGASLPYEGPDGEAWRFGLRTDHFRYFKGDTINVYVSLAGLTAEIDAQATVALVADRRVVQTFGSGSLSGGVFHMKIDTASMNTSSWPKELHIQAVADVGGEAMQVIETVRFEESVADVARVGRGDVQDEYLVIPVELDTDARGYFRVTGILFSQASKKPLVHLEGKSKISINNDTVNLKAHINALRVGGDEGPYELHHLYIEKMPGAPDYASAYGRNNDNVYPVSSQSFDSYADEHYQNPSAQRSLEFLNKMGGTLTKP